MIKEGYKGSRDTGVQGYRDIVGTGIQGYRGYVGTGIQGYVGTGIQGHTRSECWKIHVMSMPAFHARQVLSCQWCPTFTRPRAALDMTQHLAGHNMAGLPGS